ncbi:Hypothetical predicted protein [Podarcis lilfordi]|uniref:Uncharacterized protein n=1 Tax=Podarcis lilfordi TaxID=74358 RepID=A0AA35P415_9SAUR|nr:Hypothetical predicted protein [Podarcis lilfordi]
MGSAPSGPLAETEDNAAAAEDEAALAAAVDPSSLISTLAFCSAKFVESNSYDVTKHIPFLMPFPRPSLYCKRPHPHFGSVLYHRVRRYIFKLLEFFQNQLPPATATMGSLWSVFTLQEFCEELLFINHFQSWSCTISIPWVPRKKEIQPLWLILDMEDVLVLLFILPNGNILLNVIHHTATSKHFNALPKPRLLCEAYKCMDTPKTTKCILMSWLCQCLKP